MNTCLSCQRAATRSLCSALYSHAFERLRPQGAPHGGLSSHPNTLPNLFRCQTSTRAACLPQRPALRRLKPCRLRLAPPACFPIAATAMAAIGKQRMRFGGADRDRTGDPLLAKQVLSQLSYSPGCPAVAKATQRSRSGCSPAQRFFWLQVSCVGALRRLITLKEVIQPHLPIRLPCYDFTPITPPTVDGVPAGFGCERLSWCDGRCVQGPGTHSPPHADGRLLAIPASRRRVAACDPNYDAVWGFASARAVAAHCRRHCSTCVAQAIKAMRI